MVVVEGNHNRAAVHEVGLDVNILGKFSTVPGENYIVLTVDQTCGQSVCITAVSGYENVGVLLVESAQQIGKITSFVTFYITDP